MNRQTTTNRSGAGLGGRDPRRGPVQEEPDGVDVPRCADRDHSPALRRPGGKALLGRRIFGLSVYTSPRSV